MGNDTQAQVRRHMGRLTDYFREYEPVKIDGFDTGFYNAATTLPMRIGEHIQDRKFVVTCYALDGKALAMGMDIGGSFGGARCLPVFDGDATLSRFFHPQHGFLFACGPNTGFPLSLIHI